MGFKETESIVRRHSEIVHAHSMHVVGMVIALHDLAGLEIPCPIDEARLITDQRPLNRGLVNVATDRDEHRPKRTLSQCLSSGAMGLARQTAEGGSSPV